MFVIKKQPREILTRSIDISGFAEIQAGEIVESLEIFDPDKVVDNTSVVGNLVNIRFKGGGSPRTQSHVELLVLTSGGHKREIDLMLVII